MPNPSPSSCPNCGQSLISDGEAPPQKPQHEKEDFVKGATSNGLKYMDFQGAMDSLRKYFSPKDSGDSQ